MWGGWGCYDGKDGNCYEYRDCAFIISLVNLDKSSLRNFEAFDYDLHNDHNSLLIIIDHNNVKIEKLLRMLLM